MTSEYLLRKEIIVLLEKESNCRLVRYDRSSSKILYYLLLHCAIADIFGHLGSLFVAFKEWQVEWIHCVAAGEIFRERVQENNFGLCGSMLEIVVKDFQNMWNSQLDMGDASNRSMCGVLVNRSKLFSRTFLKLWLIDKLVLLNVWICSMILTHWCHTFLSALNDWELESIGVFFVTLFSSHTSLRGMDGMYWT